MLKYILNSLDEADEGSASHYTEQEDGTFILDLDGGPKDQSADVEKLNTSLRAARNDVKEVKERFRWVGELTQSEVQELRDKAEDLEYQLENGKAPSDEEIQERAERLAARQTRALESDLNETRSALSQYQQAITLHEAAANQRKIKDAVDAALSTEGTPKIHDSAREDIYPYAERILSVDEDGRVITKDGIGVDPGMTFDEVLKDMQVSGRRNHWFVGSKGGGVGGDGKPGGGYNGINPFDKKAGTWNLGNATKMAKEQPKLAKRLATEAGANLATFGLDKI